MNQTNTNKHVHKHISYAIENFIINCRKNKIIILEQPMNLNTNLL